MTIPFKSGNAAAIQSDLFYFGLRSAWTVPMMRHAQFVRQCAPAMQRQMVCARLPAIGPWRSRWNCCRQSGIGKCNAWCISVFMHSIKGEDHVHRLSPNLPPCSSPVPTLVTSPSLVLVLKRHWFASGQQGRRRAAQKEYVGGPTTGLVTDWHHVQAMPVIAPSRHSNAASCPP